MRNCPECQAAVDGLQCGRCGYAEPGYQVPKARRTTPLSALGQLAQEISDFYESDAWRKRTPDLTEQQWVNVCKYFPTVAAHCTHRPIADSTHPLWDSGRAGALFRNREIPSKSNA